MTETKNDNKSENKNKRHIEAEVDGKPVKLVVCKPSHKQQQDGQRVYNRAFREAVKPSDGGKGAILRETVEDLIKAEGLWSEEKQKEADAVRDEINEGLKKLRAGGMRKSEGRAIALKVRDDRNKLSSLTSAKNALDGQTAQSQAEQARFDFYISACTVDPDTGRPRWESPEEYREDDSDLSYKAAGAMSRILYDLDEEFEFSLPENFWLVRFQFAKKHVGKNGPEFRLIDKQGRFIDRDGRLVDDQWRYINEAGELINRDGDRVDDKGEPLVEELPFTDDEAEEATPETEPVQTANGMLEAAVA